jgi:hypothetical protein
VIGVSIQVTLFRQTQRAPLTDWGESAKYHISSRVYLLPIYAREVKRVETSGGQIE